MKLSKNKTRKVSDLTEPTLRVIKTKLINDNWPIARICLEFNLSVDSFLDEFIYYIKESNNKALNGKTTPY